MANHDPEAFQAAARDIGFRGFGFYARSGFINGLGPARRLGRLPKRRRLRDREAAVAGGARRSLKGSVAAGVMTVGAAGVELAQKVLAEMQGAILPLLRISTPCRRCFIAIAVSGVALAINARTGDWRRQLWSAATKSTHRPVPQIASFLPSLRRRCVPNSMHCRLWQELR
jgi:hypothetical protein